MLPTPSIHPAAAPPLPDSRKASGRGVLAAIGRTPLVELERYLSRPLPVWAKLESSNPGGSAKARSAARIITDAMESGRVGPETTVVESTSGNMGIGLAQACAHLGLRLVCVTDRRTNRVTAQAIRALGAEVRMIERPPPGGGDLLDARLEMVESLRREIPDSFWPNQYVNRSNPAAHRDGTMREIDEALDGRVDYVFVAVGTAGTLHGCIDYLDRQKRSTRVVAVDARGSVLFGGARGRRLLPGMGSARESEIAMSTRPDRVVRVGELDCVIACRRLAAREGILAGASSGGVLTALELLAPGLGPDARCAVILADGGTAYLDTVFDDEWVERELGCDPPRLARLVRG